MNKELVESAMQAVKRETAQLVIRTKDDLPKVLEYEKKVGALYDYAKASKEPPEVVIQRFGCQATARRRIGEWLAENVTAGNPTLTNSVTLPELGIAEMESKRWQKLARVPEPRFEELIPGQSYAKMYRAVPVPTGIGSGTFQIGAGRFQDCKIKDDSVDLIVTDPPYPKEFLPEWTDLSAFAARVLKPGGSLIAMSGQTYLPEVIERLGTHMTYQWMLSYITPGGQSAQVFPRKVNPFWKPILWYVKGDYSGEWIGDVVKSPTNQNEKESHEWQQSFGGMKDLIRRFARQPGLTIVDPFCGSGTTGVAALALNMDVHFIGIEIEPDKAEVAKARLANARG